MLQLILYEYSSPTVEDMGGTETIFVGALTKNSDSMILDSCPSETSIFNRWKSNSFIVGSHLKNPV